MKQSRSCDNSSRSVMQEMCRFHRYFLFCLCSVLSSFVVYPCVIHIVSLPWMVSSAPFVYLSHVATHLWSQPIGGNRGNTLALPVKYKSCFSQRMAVIPGKATVKWHSSTLPITALSLTPPICKHTIERRRERGRGVVRHVGFFLFTSVHQAFG